MSRDHRKLRVFTMADDLVVRVYHLTESLPREERSFLNIAFGSAAETRYLLRLSFRLRFLSESDFASADAACDELLAALNRLLQAVAKMPARREP